MDSASRSSSSSETGTLRHADPSWQCECSAYGLNARGLRPDVGHSPGAELPDHLALCCRRHLSGKLMHEGVGRVPETFACLASQRCSSSARSTLCPCRASSVGRCAGSITHCCHVLHVSRPIIAQLNGQVSQAYTLVPPRVGGAVVASVTGAAWECACDCHHAIHSSS